jgi:hypothetical protein
MLNIASCREKLLAAGSAEKIAEILYLYDENTQAGFR